MRYVLATVVSVSALTWTASAAADDWSIAKLKGAYGFTGSAGCIESPSNFNSAQQANDKTTAYASSFAVEGIRRFHGDGTGTVKGRSVGGTTSPPSLSFPPSASSDDFKFDFTYVVNSDGSWTSDMVTGSFSGTVLTGPRAGQTYVIDKIPQISGLIQEGGLTLIAAHLTPAVETLTFSSGGVTVAVVPRFCHRSRVFIKLGDRDDDRH